MLLRHCTWQEVDAYLDRSKGIVVPITHNGTNPQGAAEF